MQSGLVNDWAGEDGFSIVHQSDGQPIKPVRPFTVKMPLDDDPVDLLSNVFAFHSCAPCSPSRSLNTSMGPQQRVASSRSIRQVNQKNWNIHPCMENRRRENASRFLHQIA